MKQAEEELLVLAAQQGNEAAFNYLYRHYFASLRRFAYKLGADLDSSQDAVQEAWLSVAKSLHRLQDARAFRSWIFRAVRWQVIAKSRQGRVNHVPLDEHLHNENLLTQEPAENRQTDLLRGMEQLAEIDRQALHLFYLEEMRISEIAIALELPEGTVKSRLHRARLQLKVLLEKNEE